MSTRLYWPGLLVLVFAGGCDQVPPPPKPTPPKVTVTLPVQKDVREYHDFTGTTDAIDSVEIRARVQGFLESIHFSAELDAERADSDNPINVKKGDRLFVIEQAPFQAIVQQAEASRAAALANRIEAKANFARAEDLRQRDVGAITDVQFDQLKAAYELSEARVSAAEAEVQRAEIDLAYTEIDAPITGRISRELVDVGNLVGAGEQTLLTTIVTIDPIYAYFNISEAVLLEAREQARQGHDASGKQALPVVYLGLQTENDYPHKGELDYIDTRVDPSTGTIQVRGRFPNAEAKMLPGMFARVRVVGQPHPDALLVNERALVTDLGGKYVLVVGEDNVVDKRLVQLGQLVNGMRVVTEGLQPDERYIVKGIQRARPGFPVEPSMEESKE